MTAHVRPALGRRPAWRDLDFPRHLRARRQGYTAGDSGHMSRNQLKADCARATAALNTSPSCFFCSFTERAASTLRSTERPDAGSVKRSKRPPSTSLTNSICVSLGSAMHHSSLKPYDCNRRSRFAGEAGPNSACASCAARSKSPALSIMTDDGADAPMPRLSLPESRDKE